MLDKSGSHENKTVIFVKTYIKLNKQCYFLACYIDGIFIFVNFMILLTMAQHVPNHLTFARFAFVNNNRNSKVTFYYKQLIQQKLNMHVRASDRFRDASCWLEWSLPLPEHIMSMTC